MTPSIYKVIKIAKGTLYVMPRLSEIWLEEDLNFSMKEESSIEQLQQEKSLATYTRNTCFRCCYCGFI